MLERLKREIGEKKVVANFIVNIKPGGNSLPATGRRLNWI